MKKIRGGGSVTKKRAERRSDRFPGSLHALREKYPTGPIVQTRFQLPDGGTVSFEGSLVRGGEVERLLDIVLKDHERRQEKTTFPSSGPDGEKQRAADPGRGSHVDPERGTMHREQARREPGSPNGGRDAEAEAAKSLRAFFHPLGDSEGMLHWSKRCQKCGVTDSSVRHRTIYSEGYRGPCADSFCFATCDSPICRPVEAMTCNDCASKLEKKGRTKA
jgi:hypothetical protein